MARDVILVVDDDEEILRTIDLLLKKAYTVLTCTNGVEAIGIITTKRVDLMLVDLKMPGMDGIELLKKVKEINDKIGVILISGNDSANSAVTALKLGAVDYITKPFEVDELLLRLARYFQNLRLKDEVDYLKNEIDSEFGVSSIISASEHMRLVIDKALKVSKSSSSVLITGESGTGKEIVARVIQSNSDRRDSPFVAINCGAVSAELIESELFGHEKGAFTGAHQRAIGKFEFADKGTIFFDEVSTLPLLLQTRLLRVLQEKEFERVGGVEKIKVDVRVIAATNVNLEDAVKNGRFREDLFYRLNVVPIHIAPLRERREDIAPLIKYFLVKHSNKCKKSLIKITDEAMGSLRDYDWPGNVRELENLIERLVVLSRNSHIDQADLPLNIIVTRCNETGKPCDFSFKEACRVFEKDYILKMLEKNNWNRGKTAEAMKVHRNTLLMKMKELGIKKPE